MARVTRKQKRIDPAGVDRNGLALLVFFLATAVGYGLGAVLMMAVLDGSGEALPRDSLWKIFIYWAIVIGPQLVGIVTGLFAVRLFVRRFNRPFLFYVAVGVGLVAVCVFALMLLVPLTARSMLLLVLQAATAWIAFVILRRGLRREAT